MVAVIIVTSSGKGYRPIEENDLVAFEKAQTFTNLEKPQEFDATFSKYQLRLIWAL